MAASSAGTASAKAGATKCRCKRWQHRASVQHRDVFSAALARRDLIIGSGVMAAVQQAFPAIAGIDRYIKTKKLDPLVSYVPVLLIAQTQLGDVPLAAEELGIDATRSLLRKGAFDGLRDNVRAVGEYAAPAVGNATAQAAVKRVFVSFDSLDKALLLAAREAEPKVPDDLEALVRDAQAAIEALLETAPADDVQRGRDIVDVILNKEQGAGGDAAGGVSDQAQQEAKRLEGLL